MHHDQALRALVAAGRREANASDRLAERLEDVAEVAAERADALGDAAAAARSLADTMSDPAEARRTMRHAQLLDEQRRQSDGEARAARGRAASSRAMSRRASAQSAMYEQLITPAALALPRGGR